MALTKIGKEGITGVSNAANATFLTATSGEGVTLAGTLAVTGVHTVGTNAVATSEGGAATTNITQGLCKSWISFNGTGTVSIRDSHNTGSLTDTATGRYTITFTADMANTGYAGTANAKAFNNNSGEATYIETFDTDSYAMKHYENGTNYDSAFTAIMIAGDLA